MRLPRRPASRRGWLAAGLAVGASLVVIWLFWTWPPPLWYRWHFPHETAFMAMRRREDPDEAQHRRYKPVPLNQISPALRRAVLIGEDIRFYQHHGVDYVELRRAVGYPRDSFSWTSARDRGDLARAVIQSRKHPERIRGASTITQQLAKNLYLSPSRNPFRKVKELVTAWRLELWLPKDRILELYLNSVEMGDEIWGAEAASERYFNRPARQLTDEQAAELAAMLPFPRSSNPYYRPSRMIWRRNMILARMNGGRVAVPIDSAVAADSL